MGMRREDGLEGVDGQVLRGRARAAKRKKDRDTHTRADRVAALTPASLRCRLAATPPSIDCVLLMVSDIPVTCDMGWRRSIAVQRKHQSAWV